MVILELANSGQLNQPTAASQVSLVLGTDDAWTKLFLKIARTTWVMASTSPPPKGNDPRVCALGTAGAWKNICPSPKPTSQNISRDHDSFGTRQRFRVAAHVQLQGATKIFVMNCQLPLSYARHRFLIRAVSANHLGGSHRRSSA